MRLPKIKLFSNKRRTREMREFRTARGLFKKLLKLHVVKVILVFIAVLFLAPIILFFIYRPRVQENIIYGVTFSNRYASELGLDWQEMYLDVLDNLGVKYIRLVAYWDEIEAEKDIYNFDNIIWQLEEAKKRDVKVILSVGRKVPRYPECFEPKWWKEMGNDEFRTVELLEYLKVAIGRLKEYDNIRMWQVENEPFFPFGECHPSIKMSILEKEVALVESLDPTREILIQDSGEGGYWFPTYQNGDYLGISMYRRIWYDFWGAFLGNFIYFKYPLAHWTYKIKADLTLVPHDKIIVTELQAEPWGPSINNKLSENEKNKTMSHHHFIDTIDYAQKAGFKEYYFWGVEWWYWEKFHNNNPFYWDTAQAIFREGL